jgi:tetratricopeptide (TPR) repeat protein
MKLGQYVRLMKAMSKAHRKFTCTSCGTKTEVLGDFCMCSNCESIAHYDSVAISRKDPTLSNSLKLIGDALAAGNYEGVIAEYEKLYQYKRDPLLLYAEALAYIRYSNRTYAGISYDRPGFMEDNAAMAENAMKLASTAKALLAKSIKASRDDMAEGNSSPDSLYGLMLAQLKLGDLRGAKDSLDAMEKLNIPLVYNYAAMMLDAQKSDYRKVMAHADTILRSKNILVNAFFYAGLALFGLGSRNDAMKLFKSMSAVSESSAVPLLVSEIAERV